MSSYNLIPFTDLTATGFTNAVVTTSFTVNSFTVADSTGADAQRFVSLLGGNNSVTPAFTFASDTRSGITDSAGNIIFLLRGQIVSQHSHLSGGEAFNSFIGIGSTQIGLDGGNSNFKFWNNNNGTTAPVSLGGLVGRPLANGIWSLTDANASKQFTGVNNDLVVAMNGSNVANNTVSAWSIATTVGHGAGHHFNRVGLLQQATTTVVPSTARSSAHVTNFIAGINTVFVTLPTSIAGLKYTISNAQATAQTVVVNPVAADTLNVFGLTKVAGASVAANAPFSSITFHCITSTMWLATKKTGTWT